MFKLSDKDNLMPNLIRKSQNFAEILQNRLLRKKPESFVGINLGNYYIKGLVVKENKIIDYFLEKKGNLSSLLGQIWQKKGIPTRKVKISIKSPAALIRYFSFPRIDKKKLRDAIFYELDKHIPFSPEEVYFDFAILEEINPSEQLILLAAVKKELIDGILNTFEAQNLKISEINLDGICLINLFLKAYKDEAKINSCLLDLGHDFSSLTILRQGTPFLTRDLNFNTKDILEVVSRLKNISSIDAEKWLLSVKNYDEFLGAARNNMSNLCKEIKSSLDYFELNKSERVEKLYLSGGLATLGGIEGGLKEPLDVEVNILNNFQNLDLIFPSGDFNSFKNNLSVAVGLIL